MGVEVRNHPPRWTTIYARPYRVRALILPARSAPRVGPDHPRYMEPGTPPRLLSLHVFDDGVEITKDLAPSQRHSIEELVRKACGFPPSTGRPGRQRNLARRLRAEINGGATC